jgi:hypothetical protein
MLNMIIKNKELLNFENFQVLNLVQALLGSIGSNFRYISLICCEEKKVTLFFIIENDRLEDREEIEDIMFEFEALQDSFINDEVIIKVDSRPLREIDLVGRRVYVRKEG